MDTFHSIQYSFVIPAYNEREFISPCLDSIYDEINRYHLESLSEIIVVDNNSLDGTEDFIKTFFPDVVVIKESEQGLVPARKAGIKIARGQYIINLDADVRLPVGWFKYAISQLTGNPELVAISGPYYYYDLSRFQNAVIQGYYGIAKLLYLIVRHIFKSGSMIQGGNVMIRSDAIRASGAYENIDAFKFYGEDTELARRLSKIGKVEFSLKHKVYSSGRRIISEGLFKTGLTYTMNYFWPILFKRPFTKEWIDHRASV